MNKIIFYVIRFIISIVLLKEFVKKNKDIILYYNALRGYYPTMRQAFLVYFASLLLVIDFFVILGLLMTKDISVICFCGIALQVMTLIRLVCNYGKEFKGNCNCFSSTLPRHVEFNSLTKTMLFIYVYFLLLILNNFYGGV